MRTEQEWAVFAKYVAVGARIKWTYGEGGESYEYEGVLLENYPHTEKATAVEAPFTHVDLLQVRFAAGDIFPILANYADFWIEAWDGWYRFGDILMGEDEDA